MKQCQLRLSVLQFGLLELRRSLLGLLGQKKMNQVIRWHKGVERMEHLESTAGLSDIADFFIIFKSSEASASSANTSTNGVADTGETAHHAERPTVWR